MNRVDVLLMLVAVALMIAGCNRTAPDSSSKVEPVAEHAVLVYLKLSDDEFGTAEERNQNHELSDLLKTAIETKNAGEFDGDEFGDGQCTLFMYGPNADALFQAVEPILRDSPLSFGGHAIKRYGEASDADAKEVRVDF